MKKQNNFGAKRTKICSFLKYFLILRKLTAVKMRRWMFKICLAFILRYVFDSLKIRNFLYIAKNLAAINVVG